MKNIAIIGAGPAGMAAAITAAQSGAKVVVFERNDIAGKKLLLTGNGKCNFTNVDIHADYFSFEEGSFADSIVEHMSVRDVCDFFAELGVLSTERKGCFYPFNGQASTVRDALVHAMTGLGVEVIYHACIGEISRDKEQFVVHMDNKRICFDAVILACGGKAAPKTGSDGFGYRLARSFGHTVSRTYPVLVQLLSDAPHLNAISGVRCYANVSALVDGKKVASDYGELQLADYGLSGIPVFHLSRFLSKDVEEGRECVVLADFMPQISVDALEQFLDKRLVDLKGYPLRDFIGGLVHSKLVNYFINEYGLCGDTTVTPEDKNQILNLLTAMKSWKFHITGHKGFENAQVTKGGVLLDEIDENMESKLMKGLFFAGEMLDVDADCGGYNLHWAWASGMRAGETAAK